MGGNRCRLDQGPKCLDKSAGTKSECQVPTRAFKKPKSYALHPKRTGRAMGGVPEEVKSVLQD